MQREYHVPVLAAEVLELVAFEPGAVAVDGTLGGGGHAALIAERIRPGGTLIAIDRDLAALDTASERLSDSSVRIVAVHGDFRNVASLARERGFESVDGVLLDLGVSSHQLDEVSRGFSFRGDALLDMRMDPTQGETASDLLARLDEPELARTIRELGEDRWAARIAKFIVGRREAEPIRTTAQLAAVVSAAIPRGAWPRDIHPATRTFQALRIAVNDELGALRQGLDGAVDLLALGGRIAVISYHSLEDRVVKQTFARLTGRCQCPPGLPVCRCGAQTVLKLITRKPVVPSDQEVKRNLRARSARLRVAAKVIAHTQPASR